MCGKGKVIEINTTKEEKSNNINNKNINNIKILSNKFPYFIYNIFKIIKQIDYSCSIQRCISINDKILIIRDIISNGNNEKLLPYTIPINKKYNFEYTFNNEDILTEDIIIENQYGLNYYQKPKKEYILKNKINKIFFKIDLR